MKTHNVWTLVLAVALGALGTLFVMRQMDNAQAGESVSAQTGVLMATGKSSGNTDMVYLIDTNAMTLACYEITSTGQIALTSARKVDIDLKLVELNNGGKFSRTKVVDEYQKSQREEKRNEEKKGN